MGIVLVPEGEKPEIPAVAVAVQVKVAPARLEVKLTKAVVVPEQMVWVKGVVVKTGVSLIVKDLDTIAEAPHSLLTTKKAV